MSAIRAYLGDLFQLAPYGILTAGALLLLVAPLGGSKRESKPMLTAVAVLSVLGAAFSLFLLPTLEGKAGPFLVHDRIGFGFGLTFLFLLLLVLPLLPTQTVKLKERPSAVLSLFLLSACGGLLMIFTDHLLVFFIGLELLSIPLYILCGLGADSKKGSEAAFKYFLLGAIASAFFVYGIALFWGSVGTVRISEISGAVAPSAVRSHGLATVAMVLMFTGVAFKIGSAPFHMWVPDVYEGAPATVVSWMAGGVKAAALVVALRLFGGTEIFQTPLWSQVVSAVAILSMVWGSLGALYQTNMKRMLGYSAVAHAGYALIALVCAMEGAFPEAAASLAFYVLAYGVATMASFLVFSFEEDEGRSAIRDLGGLAIRKPALAFALAVALLSLAGLPPLGGFMGKFNIFVLAAHHGHYGLVIVALLTSIISLGYYLRLIVSAYMEKPAHAASLPVHAAMGTALAVTVVVTFVLGLIPGSAIALFSGVP